MTDLPDSYTLTFSGEQLQVLNDALIELPFRRAMPVITSINEQIRAATSEPGDTL